MLFSDGGGFFSPSAAGYGRRRRTHFDTCLIPAEASWRVFRPFKVAELARVARGCFPPCSLMGVSMSDLLYGIFMCVTVASSEIRWNSFFPKMVP